MNDIELLDKAIEIYSKGNQAKFSKFSHIWNDPKLVDTFLFS